jgi:hypothetical protein
MSIEDRDRVMPETPLSPRTGDELIRGDLPDWQNNACLNFLQESSQSAYAEGYKLGARLLVQHVVETHADQDFLVYPIIFLYRHHIELALKRIIGRQPSLVERPLSADVQAHRGKHRLGPLWQDLKPMLAEICEAAGWTVPDRDDMEGIDNYIRQLEELDPNSYSFRYASSKRGAASLPADLTHINLRHFAEMLERLAAYLDGIDAATSALEDSMAEWRSDMASYME